VHILNVVLALNSGFALIRCARAAFCSINFIFSLSYSLTNRKNRLINGANR
jgi:hypothetical protein